MSEKLFIPPEGAMQFEFYPNFAVLEGVPFTWAILKEGVLCPDGHRSYRDCRDLDGDLLCECGGRVVE